MSRLSMLSIRDQFVVTVVLVLIIICTFQFTIRLPMISQLKELSSEVDDSGQELTEAQLLVTQITALEQELVHEQHVWDEADVVLPGQIWSPGLLAYLETLALDAGLDLLSISIDTDEDESGFYCVCVGLIVEGSLDQHRQFVDHVSALEVLTHYDQLVMRRDVDTDMIVAEYRLQMFEHPQQDDVWTMPIDIN